MKDQYAPIGAIMDHDYRITWASQFSGAFAGIRAGTSELPGPVARRYLEALDRCLRNETAVAWIEPGEAPIPPVFCQAFPLPMSLGVIVTAVDPRQFPRETLLGALELDPQNEWTGVVHFPVRGSRFPQTA